MYISYTFYSRTEAVPVKCDLDGLKIKETSDGYLLGISSPANLNMDIKSSESDETSQDFSDQAVGRMVRRFRRQIRDDKKIHRSVFYENLQRSYSRAELQFGLSQLRNLVTVLRTDTNYEICKIRGQIWDNAFAHPFDSPDLMARFLFPLEPVKGLFKDNVLEVVYGSRAKDMCIPKPAQFDGLHLNLMIKGQPFWLRSSTGEILSSAPSTKYSFKISSFVIPLLPSGYYDIIDGRFTEDNNAYLHDTVSSTPLLFSTPELFSIQDLISWNSNFQTYESDVLNEIGSRTEKMFSPKTSFDELIATPLSNAWDSFSLHTQSVLNWIGLVVAILILIYIVANIVIPLIKLKRKTKYGDKKLKIREEQIEMNRANLRAF